MDRVVDLVEELIPQDGLIIQNPKRLQSPVLLLVLLIGEPNLLILKVAKLMILLQVCALLAPQNICVALSPKFPVMP